MTHPQTRPPGPGEPPAGELPDGGVRSRNRRPGTTWGRAAGSRKPRPGPLTRSVAVLGLVVSGLLIGAGPALAHDRLEETSPADGSSVKTLPDQIELTYNETVLALGSVVKVVGPDGDVTDGKATVVDNTVTQAIEPGPAGDYTVQWRVTSSDGHPISGEFGFTAQAGSETTEPTATEPATGTTTATPATTAAGSTGPAAVAGDSTDDDGGVSPVLVITLVVLAVVVIGAVVYLFVLAPKRAGED